MVSTLGTQSIRLWYIKMEQRQNLAVIRKMTVCFVKPGICGRKKLIAQVELILKDGTRKIVCTSNENWLWVNGPTVFQNWYGGEDYDGRIDWKAYGMPDADCSNWAKVAVCQAPNAKLVARQTAPLKVMKRYSPVSVTKQRDGSYLYDLERIFQVAWHFALR